MLQKLFIVSGICLFTLFCGCKKDNPVQTAPDIEFTGCKLIKIESANLDVAWLLKYSNNNLQKKYSATTTGNSYSYFKFLNNTLVEYGHHDRGKNSPDAFLIYDDKGKLAKRISPPFIDLYLHKNSQHYFYNTEGNCNYILKEALHLSEEFDTVTWLIDSMVFNNYTLFGMPKSVDHYYSISSGPIKAAYYLSHSYAYEYNNSGNIIKYSQVKYSPYSITTCYEYEYDYTKVLNDEYIEYLNINRLTSNDFISSPSFNPLVKNQYPLTKTISYDQNGVVKWIANHKNIFDSLGKLIYITTTTLANPKDSTVEKFYYECR